MYIHTDIDIRAYIYVCMYVCVYYIYSYIYIFMYLFVYFVAIWKLRTSGLEGFRIQGFESLQP